MLFFGWTISQYQSMWLPKLNEHRQSGATLDKRCERFVTGVNNNAIQRKLLRETDFTLDKAVSLSISGANDVTQGQVHETDFTLDKAVSLTISGASP